MCNLEAGIDTKEKRKRDKLGKVLDNRLDGLGKKHSAIKGKQPYPRLSTIVLYRKTRITIIRANGEEEGGTDMLNRETKEKAC